jgi:hypothetical protein
MVLGLCDAIERQGSVQCRIVGAHFSIVRTLPVFAMHVEDALEFVAGARAIFGDEMCHSGAFLTAKVREGDRPTMMIALCPRGRTHEFAAQRWSFRSLLTFINGLSGAWGCLKTGCTQDTEGVIPSQMKF